MDSFKFSESINVKEIIFMWNINMVLTKKWENMCCSKINILSWMGWICLQKEKEKQKEKQKEKSS